MSLDELRTYKQQVEWLFGNYPETVGNYTQLDYQWLRNFCNLPYLDRETFLILIRNIGKLQNVERASRKLREGKGNNLRENEYRRAIMKV